MKDYPKIDAVIKLLDAGGITRRQCANCATGLRDVKSSQTIDAT
jgi:hypothetical protein